MRRRKPHQQIYTPGSGPLRKRITEEGNESDTSYSTDMKQVNDIPSKHRQDIRNRNNNDSGLGREGDGGKRRNKKPEQALYVPKPVAKAMRDTYQNDNSQHNEISFEQRSRVKSHRHRNGHRDDNSQSKRLSNRRHESDRRDFRQASEPRAEPLNRVRDTRSVEPAGNSIVREKIQAKPPSGRRHSTIGLESKILKSNPNFESLPPRLIKKYPGENENQSGIYPNYSSVNYPMRSCSGFPPDPTWSNTIPSPRTRGRGRLRPEEFENELMERALRSPGNSRPCTPPFSGRGRLRPEDFDPRMNTRSVTPDLTSPLNSRPCTPFGSKVNVVEADKQKTQQAPAAISNSNSPNETSPPSTVSPSKTSAKTSISTLRDDEEFFDWSEEVEMHERLEAGHMSDSITRASSVVSLVENPPPPPQPSRRAHKKNNRNRSLSRNNKREKSNDNQNRQIVREKEEKESRPKHKRGGRHSKEKDAHRESNHGKDIQKDHKDRNDDVFKVPEPRRKGRRNSFRDRSHDRIRLGKSQNSSRHSSMERIRRDSTNDDMNWREEIRQRCDAERRMERREPEKNGPAPGIIILPKNVPDRSKPPSLPASQMPQRKATQRTLYDPKNPNKLQVVNACNSRVDTNVDPPMPDMNSLHITDPFGNMRPAWYDPYSLNFRECHFPHHLLDVQKADMEMQFIVNSGAILRSWNIEVASLRQFFRDSFEFLLMKDIKFCEKENVENHYWKIMYYNIIELMRKSIGSDPENKEQYKKIILSLIDEGTKYFEKILDSLEETYKFRLDNYLGTNTMMQNIRESRFVGLALVSAQKIFLFLGDLARYKEQVNETSNYRVCKQWYIKAQEINPKNGKPYNQLALLAVYERRKLDAVYYYMRSLMSSNPVQSARESLISLFDENRKKYEQSEKKRREERAKLHMKEKETSKVTPNALRREIWVHPDGGRRLHRTTSAAQDESEEEDLSNLSSVDVNKRFVTSYLLVHGKLITKIGMETFQEAAVQMLREFRALLQHSPVLLTTSRFLRLLALNMFAIGSTQLKGPQLEPRCRSEVQERALVVSLQMFSVILERCVALLQEQLRAGPGAQGVLSEDLRVVLPAVKVWCDWMLCHSSIWNPPPSCSDYRTGPPGTGDTWTRLATLMNMLERLECSHPQLEPAPSKQANEQVRLPEDGTMCGFTPLMHNAQEPMYVDGRADMEAAQSSLRISRILFFGTVFLCGLEPPVLKLQRHETSNEYVSVVRRASCDSAESRTPPADLLLESFSEDEGEDENEGEGEGKGGRVVTGEGEGEGESEGKGEAEGEAEGPAGADETAPEIRHLLDRKTELERRQRSQELQRQYVQAILHQSVVSVEIEVRPRHLVPDTNCFIDYLDRLRAIAKVHGPYTLMVPLVVLGELEGLARGGRTPAPGGRSPSDPEHMLMVAEAARRALEFLHGRNPNVKCLTTRGTVLPSSSFTSEDGDQDVGLRNDDRILSACLSLCKAQQEQEPETGSPRKLFRDLVLLTEDRNLRVKAIARDVPVRELPDFLHWAGLSG